MDPNQKYDRQLRLWHHHGQEKLQNANVLVINATALGSETLKNLVLPGIGSFTVVDGSLVTEADLGRNFFLTRECVGKHRSTRLVALLNELNEAVEGKAVTMDASEFIRNAKLDEFTLVVATALSKEDGLVLGRLCWEKKIPLVIARVYGFYGLVRIVKQEHQVIESHSTETTDFRFDTPFASLNELVASTDLTGLDGTDASHVPFVVLLFKAMEDWKRKKGKMPVDYNEKKEFKHLVLQMKHPEAIDDENVQEAASNAYRVHSPSSIADSTRQLLERATERVKRGSTDEFWLVCAAIGLFVRNEGKGLLPVQGVIPDMKADTDSFVKLQTIYKNKAKQDIQHVRRHLDTLLEAAGLSHENISNETVERYCKNAATIQVVDGVSLDEEYQTPGKTDDNELVAVYWLLRAVDDFQAKHGHYPAQDSTSEIEQQIQQLIVIVNSSNGQSIPSALVQEFVRAGASEMHCIAALVGGIAAQEIIKLATHQYVPIDNTLILDGVKSTTASFRF